MWLYHRVMNPNDADGMANSVDPDLGAVWSGSALFAEAYLSENLGSLRYSPSPLKFRLHDTTGCIQLDVWNFLFHSPCKATQYSLILTTCIYPYHKSITFSCETVTLSADADEIIVPLCIIIIFAGLHQLRGQVVRRRFWVRGWIRRRSTFGAYHVLLKELSDEDQKGYKKLVTELFTNINTCAVTPYPGFSLATCQWVIEIWEKYPKLSWMQL